MSRTKMEVFTKMYGQGAKTDQLIVYVAHAMTGLPWNKVKENSERVRKILENNGIKVIDPINIENESVSESISTDTSKIPNRADDGGKKAWYGDKTAIREAHVVLDITPELKSEGVLRELGYARFYLWKPVVRLYKEDSEPHMITVFEDDAVVRSLEEAVKVMKEKWGTREKRVTWRKALLQRCLPNFIKHQIEEFK